MITVHDIMVFKQFAHSLNGHGPLRHTKQRLQNVNGVPCYKPAHRFYYTAYKCPTTGIRFMALDRKFEITA